MANEIEIKLRITESGIEIFDDAGKKMEAFGKKAASAAGDDGAGGGLKTFVKGMADAKAAYDIFSQAISQSVGMIDNINQIGVVSLRAKAGFEALGGSADTIERMQTATRGLVDDTLLLQEATHAMSSGAAQSADDLVKIAEIGATLGITFRGDAATGVMEFTKAIESVGNVRSLRGLGIDVQAVKARLEELKGTMSDADAWRLAVLDVAGENAKKLAGALDSTGTSLERLKIKFDDFVENQAERVAIGLEAIVGWWEKLAENPELTLSLTIREVTGQGKRDTYQLAADQVGSRHGITFDQQDIERFRDLYNQGTAGSAGTYQGLVSTFGQQIVDEVMRELGSRPNALNDILAQSGGLQPYYARYIPNYGGKSSGTDRYGIARGAKIDMSIMDEDEDTTADASLLRGRKPAQWRTAMSYGQDDVGFGTGMTHQGEEYSRMLGTARDIWEQITDKASEYDLKMRQVLAPLQEQQRILEQRAAIQSIDDAFGVKHDGLYSEIGADMDEAIATRRQRYSDELKKKIGTGGRTEYVSAAEIRAYDERAKAEREAYERSIGDPTAAELYKGGDYRKARMAAYDKSRAGARSRALRRTKGKTYSKTDYERDMAAFDREAKEATDAYAIATGAATKESIKFRDQLESAKKSYEDGKISLAQYKNELLLLGEAAKSGTTSLDELNQIQRRINLDARPGAKSDADKSIFDQYAGGVKTKGSAAGAAGEKETKPFDAVIANANQASAATAEIGTKGAVAVAALTVAGALAASQIGQLATQGGNAVSIISQLHKELNTLASLSITVNATKQPSGGRDTTPARGPR